MDNYEDKFKTNSHCNNDQGNEIDLELKLGQPIIKEQNLIGKIDHNRGVLASSRNDGQTSYIMGNYSMFDGQLIGPNVEFNDSSSIFCPNEVGSDEILQYQSPALNNLLFSYRKTPDADDGEVHGAYEYDNASLWRKYTDESQSHQQTYQRDIKYGDKEALDVKCPSSVVAFTTEYDGRLQLYIVDNSICPSYQFAGKMREIFLSFLEPNGTNWMNVTDETKELYYEKFQKLCKWDPDINDSIQALYPYKAANSYKYMIYIWKKQWFENRKKPTLVSDDIWDTFVKYWNDRKVKKKAEQNRKNRMSKLPKTIANEKGESATK